MLNLPIIFIFLMLSMLAPLGVFAGVTADDGRFDVVNRELDVVERSMADDGVQFITEDSSWGAPLAAAQDREGFNPGMERFGPLEDQDIVRRVESIAGEDNFEEKEEEFYLDNISAEVGTEFSYFKYKEPGLMRDVGYHWGITGALTSRLPALLANGDSMEQPVSRTGTTMLRIEGLLSWGQVDYSSEGTGELDNIKDWIFEIRGLAGVDYEVTPRIL